MLSIVSNWHICRWILMNWCLPCYIVKFSGWRANLLFFNVYCLHNFLSQFIYMNEALPRVRILIYRHPFECFLQLIDPCKFHSPVSILQLSWWLSLLLKFLITFLVLIPKSGKNRGYLPFFRFLHGCFLVLIGDWWSIRWAWTGRLSKSRWFYGSRRHMCGVLMEVTWVVIIWIVTKKVRGIVLIEIQVL
jgi:hypothetical protein